MNRTHVIGGAAVAVVLVLALGAAVYTGAGPFAGGESGDPITDFPTATPSDDGTGATGTSAATADNSPFTFTIEETETCGQTCRDVTATLDNNQDHTATGVTVYIRIFAGQNNTATGDIVWEGTQDVGSLDAGASFTTTQRVELSLQEGRQVEGSDGWITILTTVESDETTVTFQDSEQVA